MTKTRWYKGESIRPFSRLGSPFRWEAYVIGRGFIYADTLGGIKNLITQTLEDLK